MTFAAPEYRASLLALLPSGPAWPREPGTVLYGLVGALAEEFARFDERMAKLQEEADPRTAYEMLEDWERVLGLPDPCTSIDSTIAARQAAVWRKLAIAAGQTKAFYIATAAALGFEIEIHEFDPDVDDYDASLTALIAGGKYRLVWRVHVLNAGDFTYFRFGDEFGQRFVEGDAAFDLECVITSAKPAHTHVIFSYPEA